MIFNHTLSIFMSGMEDCNIRIWKKSCGKTPRIGKSRSRTAGAERAVVETRIQSRELRKQASEEGIGIKTTDLGENNTREGFGPPGKEK